MTMREKRHRRAMLAAIRAAASEVAPFRGTSLTNGLRCIRTFERVNAIPFDPFDRLHLFTVTGMGVHEGTFRRVRLLTHIREER